MNKVPIGKWMAAIHKNIHSIMTEKLKPYDINPGQLEYFIVISKNEGINQKELTEKMNVGKPSTTKAVKKLLDCGLIKRRPNINDSRHNKLYITNKGKDLVKTFTRIFWEINDSVLKGITQDEIKILKDILIKMYKNTPSKKYNIMEEIDFL